MRDQPNAPAEVYGPYETAALIGADVIPFLTLPYVDVVDSTAVISLNSDNSHVVFDSMENQPNGNDWYLIAHVEVAVYGSIQGYQTLLKRQHIRFNYGPAMIHFSAHDVYDQVVFKARLFIGGKPGIPNDIIFNPNSNAAGTMQLSLPAVVNICRRQTRRG